MNAPDLSPIEPLPKTVTGSGPARTSDVKDKVAVTAPIEFDHAPPVEKDNMNAPTSPLRKQIGEIAKEAFGKAPEQFGRDKNLKALISDRNISDRAIQEAIRTSSDMPISERVPITDVTDLNDMVRARMNMSHNMPSTGAIAKRSLRLSTPPEEGNTTVIQPKRASPTENYPPSVKAEPFRRSPFQRYDSETEFPPLFERYSEDKYFVGTEATSRPEVRVSTSRDMLNMRSPFQRYESEIEFPPLFGVYPEDKLPGSSTPFSSRLLSDSFSTEFRPLFGNFDDDDSSTKESTTRTNFRRSDRELRKELYEDIRKGFTQFGRDVKGTARDIREGVHDTKENVRKNARYIGQEIRETTHDIKEEVRDIADESSDMLSSWWNRLMSMLTFTPSTSEKASEKVSEKVSSGMNEIKASAKEVKEDVRNVAADTSDKVGSWWDGMITSLTPQQSTTMATKERLQSTLGDIRGSAHGAKENIKGMANNLADRLHGMVFNKVEEPGYHGEYERYIPAIDSNGDIRDVELGIVDITHFGG